MRPKEKKETQKIARERIQILFKKAQEDPEFADRYAELILKIAMKANIRLPDEIKWRICKKCRSFLTEGKNARTRLKDERIIQECLKCGNKKTKPYIKEKKAKKKKVN